MVGVPPQSPCQPPPQHHGSRGQARRCWALPGPGSHAVPRRAALSPAKPCCLPPAWHRTTSPGHPDTPRPAPCILLPCRGACNGADPPPQLPSLLPTLWGQTQAGGPRPHPASLPRAAWGSQVQPSAPSSATPTSAPRCPGALSPRGAAPRHPTALHPASGTARERGWSRSAGRVSARTFSQG